LPPFYPTPGLRPWSHERAALTVAADRFHRTAFHGFLAERFFFGGFRLFVNEGMSAVVISFVIRGRRFPAKVAVDALIIDVELAIYVLRILVCGVGHILFP
jgi:hypothetical protein